MMIQEIWQHHRGFREEKELRTVRVKNHAINTFTLLFGKSKGKGLDDRNCLKSITRHAAGIRTCTHSGMTIPSNLSSEMHLAKFLDPVKFHNWIVNLRAEVCSKAKNPTLPLQWIKEIEAAKSLDDFITPKSITGKDFPDYEELDLMMAAALKRCYEKNKHTSERRSVSKSKGLKRTTDFSEGDKLLIWSTKIFDLLDLMMKFKDYRGCSV